jgi:hypothetical protein
MRIHHLLFALLALGSLCKGEPVSSADTSSATSSDGGGSGGGGDSGGGNGGGGGHHHHRYHHTANPGGAQIAQPIIMHNFMQAGRLNRSATNLAQDPLNKNLRDNYQQKLVDTAVQHSALMDQFDKGNLAESDVRILKSLGNLVNQSPQSSSDQGRAFKGDDTVTGGAPASLQMGAGDAFSTFTGTDTEGGSRPAAAAKDSERTLSSPIASGLPEGAAVTPVGDGIVLLVKAGTTPSSLDSAPALPLTGKGSGENENTGNRRKNTEDFFSMVAEPAANPSNERNERGIARNNSEGETAPEGLSGVFPHDEELENSQRPIVLVDGQWKEAPGSAPTRRNLAARNEEGNRANFAGMGEITRARSKWMTPLNWLKFLATILAAVLCAQLVLWYRARTTESDEPLDLISLDDLIRQGKVLALNPEPAATNASPSPNAPEEHYVGFEAKSKRWIILKADESRGIEQVGVLQPGSVVSARRMKGEEYFHFKLSPDGSWTPTQEKEGFLLSVKGVAKRKAH